MDPNTAALQRYYRRDPVTLFDDLVQLLADDGCYNEAAAVHAVLQVVEERSRTGLRVVG